VWLEASEADDNRLADLVGEPAGLADEDVAAIADELFAAAKAKLLS
jgi:hypothetical protein